MSQPPPLSEVCLFSLGKSMFVCYSDRGGSVLWSAGSAFIVCCLKSASPLSSVLFPRSIVAGAVPGLIFLWVVLEVLSWSGGDTSSLSRVGTVLGLFFWVVEVTGGFSSVGVRAGGLSWEDKALLRAATGVKSRDADTPCWVWAVEVGHPEPRATSSSGEGYFESAIVPPPFCDFSSSFLSFFSPVVSFPVSLAEGMKDTDRWKSMFKLKKNEEKQGSKE